MLGEVAIHKLSQLVYLDVPAAVTAAGPPTVGKLAGYYTNDKIGRAYIKTRFGAIPQEYEDWKSFLTEGLDDVADFRIRNVLDDNRKKESGFYGCCYISPERDLVAAFRGSEMLGNQRYKNDYETDLALAYQTTTPQQRVVEEYLEAFDDFRTRPYYLTGHSLGGNLAAYGAVCGRWRQGLMGCYAFNAPGFNTEFLEKNAYAIQAVQDRVYLMENEHDPVSSMLKAIARPQIIRSTFHPGEADEPGVPDILYPHSNFLYQMEGDRFVRREDGKKDRLCRMVSLLTDRILRLSLPVRKAVATMLLDALYAPKPGEKQLEYLLESATKRLVATGGGEEEAMALGGNLFAAKMQWTEQQDTVLYHHLMDEGESGHDRLPEAIALLLKLAQYITHTGV